MASVHRSPSASVERFVQRIRPAVRDLRPYRVGGVERPLAKLNQNESPFNLPPEIKGEILEAFADVSFNRYPSEQPDRLTRAYAAYVGCSPDAVLAGNGSSDITGFLGLTLIERNTPVVLPAPMFSLYARTVRLHDGHLIEVPCRDDLRFDVGALVEAIRTYRPPLTVLTTPNNPTGLAMNLDEVEEIAGVSDGFVVVDEAYVEFSDQGSAMGLLESHPNLLFIRTLSKAGGLAALRVGFLIARPDVIREFEKGRLPFVVDPLASAAGCILLAHPEVLADQTHRIRQSYVALADALAALDDVEVVPSQANFLLFRTPVKAPELAGRLADRGVLVRSLQGYVALQDFLRVTAGTEMENNAFLAALKGALAGRC